MHRTLFQSIICLLLRDAMSIEFITSERGQLLLVDAFQKGFPSAVLSGCLFYLGQNIQRHVTDAEMADRYSNNTKFSLCLNLLKNSIST